MVRLNNRKEDILYIKWQSICPLQSIFSKYYNELNRNMDVIRKINTTCKLHTKVIKNSGHVNRNIKVLYLPVSYEVIDLADNRIMDKLNLKEKVYLGPAGVRSSEWFFINKEKLDTEICGFFDNNIEKVGKQIMGKPIFSMKQVTNDQGTVFVIASKYYSLEIEEQLLRFFSKNKILNASYMLSTNFDGTIYYFNLDKYKRLCVE